MDPKATMEERRRAVWLTREAGDIAQFQTQISTKTRAEDWPQAIGIIENIPIYSGDYVRAQASSPQSLMAEWTTCLSTGPGIFVIKRGIKDSRVIDRATEVFEQIIETEVEAGGGGGDHFAKAGANNRVWNAVQKHCLADPENFAHYYGADAIALASRAWLGAGYQMTAQVNRVNPGGAAQAPHRDYHLGFMSPPQMEAYPAHIHHVSPVLTLQGAVAHCDMPLESGPTVVLPYSQLFFEGYLAFGRPEFQAHFAQHAVQLPLEKGDMMFFNPALMHGAGTNESTDIFRMANLLQVSSAFGRAMEAVDRNAMSRALYPALQAMALPRREIENAVAACAEGYAFPTNLDRDPPVGGLAPKTQAEQMLAALDAGVPAQEWNKRVEEWDRARRA